MPRWEDTEPEDKKDVPKYEDTEPDPETTPYMAGVSSVAQGLTGNFSDEIIAGGKSAIDRVFGGQKYSEAYDKNIKYERDKIAKLRNAYPKLFFGGEMAGGIASPIGKIGKAAKLGKVAGSAAEGALSAYGASEDGDPLTDIALGATIGGGVGKLSKSAKALGPAGVGKKLASVFLNTPEELTEIYMKDPKGVLNAPLRHELATRFAEKIDELQKQVIEGSKESRDILSKEGATFSRNEIADVFDKLADDLTVRMEGVDDTSGMVAARGWLKDKASSYRVKQPKESASGLVDEFGKPLQATAQSVDKRVSSNKLKDTIQDIQRETDYDVGGGKFVKIPDQDKKRVSALLNETLKAKSPAYREQMVGVAKDADLLERTSDIAKSPQTMANIFRRIETDKYGPGQLPRPTIAEFDKRMGTDFLKQSGLSLARESFDKSVTQGSRNVNLFSNMMRDIPVLKYFAPIVGATVDKYGKKMTMGAVDTAKLINDLYKQKQIEPLAQTLEYISKAADARNAEALLVLKLINQSNPDLSNWFAGKERK